MNNEFTVKEDKFGNLILKFDKEVIFSKGENIFIYNPFNNNYDVEKAFKIIKNDVYKSLKLVKYGKVNTRVSGDEKQKIENVTNRILYIFKKYLTNIGFNFNKKDE